MKAFSRAASQMFAVLLLLGVCFSPIALTAADLEKGEANYRKCKACHQVADGADLIVKGGRTGPNLFGIVGRAAGSVQGYKYSPDLKEAGERGLVWNEELLVEYVENPKAFLTNYLGKNARSRMSFRMKKSEDIIAYLASFNKLDVTTGEGIDGARPNATDDKALR